MCLRSVSTPTCYICARHFWRPGLPCCYPCCVRPSSRELTRFVEEMPNARLVWVEECGHVPHLEQPDKTANSIVDFVQNGNPAKVEMQTPSTDASCCFKVHHRVKDCNGTMTYALLPASVSELPNYTEITFDLPYVSMLLFFFRCWAPFCEMKHRGGSVNNETPRLTLIEEYPPCPVMRCCRDTVFPPI